MEQEAELLFLYNRIRMRHHAQALGPAGFPFGPVEPAVGPDPAQGETGRLSGHASQAAGDAPLKDPTRPGRDWPAEGPPETHESPPPRPGKGRGVGPPFPFACTTRRSTPASPQERGGGGGGTKPPCGVQKATRPGPIQHQGSCLWIVLVQNGDQNAPNGDAKQGKNSPNCCKNRPYHVLDSRRYHSEPKRVRQGPAIGQM